MNYKLIINISKGLLFARKRQTLVAAIGVTFSITMFITLLSFMTGLNNMLDDLVVNRTPHIRLYNEPKPSNNQPVNDYEGYKNDYNFISSVKSNNSRIEIYNSAAIVNAIQHDSRVLGIAPRLNTQAFFNAGAIDISGVVTGIDIQEEQRLFHFTDYLIAGNAVDLKNVANSIILGKPLADKLMADIGDVIQVTTTNGERFSLKVVGYFQSGLQDFDKAQSYTSVTTAQKLLGQPGQYLTDIQVELKDINQAPKVAKEYSQLFGIEAQDIQTANAEFATGNFIRSLIAYSVGVVLLIVSGFGIYNILHMMIYEKMDSIAILKATGFSGNDVKRIFMVIALSIGFFGGLTGLLFGFILSSIIDQLPFVTKAFPTITTYPINYNPAFYFIGSSFSLIATYFAGYFPARKASKIDPVIIIRGK